MLLPCVGRTSPDLPDLVHHDLCDTFDSRITVPRLIVSTEDKPLNTSQSNWDFTEKNRGSTTGPWLVRPGEKLNRGPSVPPNSDNRTYYQRTGCILPTPYSPIDEDNIDELVLNYSKFE